MRPIARASIALVLASSQIAPFVIYLSSPPLCHSSFAIFIQETDAVGAIRLATLIAVFVFKSRALPDAETPAAFVQDFYEKTHQGNCEFLEGNNVTAMLPVFILHCLCSWQ